MEITINGMSCVGTQEECAKFINKMLGTIESLNTQEEKYVDLGLPSGTLWAKCNIGAENEWESGKYFMWGDIVGRTADEARMKPCNWHTAPFGEEDNLNKIKDVVCPNGILAKEHDAAYVNTNGKAHMPTKEQFEELGTNTIVTWEENFNGSGVNGRKFTSKKDSSKYIFIPACGCANYGSLGCVGSDGYVWSSSFYTSSPNNAWFLRFHSGGVSVSNFNRYFGPNVRGVISK